MRKIRYAPPPSSDARFDQPEVSFVSTATPENITDFDVAPYDVVGGDMGRYSMLL